MDHIDLDKYKEAWKKEPHFEEKKLSQAEISGFLKSASRNILALFKKGIIFDIIFKFVLLISLFVLIYLVPHSIASIYLILFLGLITILGIGWQIYILRQIPEEHPSEQTVLEILHKYLGFYHKKYIHSIFIGALSSSLFFLIGSIYYYYFKYEGIPNMQIDDFMVLGIGLVLSYSLSAIAQITQHNFRIKQLELRVKEIEEDTITEQSITNYRSAKLRNVLLTGIALGIGLLLFIFLIYKMTI
ncbi:MAG: hypothetical protein KDE26_27520 [Bacteroidetes bacterium]|nr:hypothetical protein [Bacteroidota bacterium]